MSPRFYVGRRPTRSSRVVRNLKTIFRVELLEDRLTPSSLYVDNPADFIITTDQGAPGLDAGDTVTFNPSGGTQTSHSGLVYGTNAFGTIQSAVDAATAGDIINVAQGTFSEAVTVNKTLTLQGNQFGVDARQAGRTGAAATETVVNGNAGVTPFNVTASNVVLNGFTVSGNTSAALYGYGVRVAPGTSGTHVLDNIVQDNIAGIAPANTDPNNPTLIQGNLIRNNNQPGPVTGVGIYSDQSTAGGPLTGVVIFDNTITGEVNGILLGSTDAAAPSSNVTISSNILDANSSNALLAFNLRFRQF